MTEHLLHVCECYMSFRPRLEELIESFSEPLAIVLAIADSTSEVEEQGMWLCLWRRVKSQPFIEYSPYLSGLFFIFSFDQARIDRT